MLQEIEGISTLVNLEYLYLGKNKITRLQNVDNLVNLRTLSLQVSTDYAIIRFVMRRGYIYCDNMLSNINLLQALICGSYDAKLIPGQQE